MGFLKKLSHNTNNFFKKLDSGASNAFKKIGNGINQAGDFANNAVNDAAGVGKKVGNFLEKNSGNIANAAAGLAMASGVGAEFAPAIIAGGQAAQRFGGNMKRVSNTTQQSLNNSIGASQMRASDFNNTLNNAVQGAVNQGRTMSQDMINQTQSRANNLGSQLNFALRQV